MEQIELAQDTDIAQLVSLINEAYALSENELWVDGWHFMRTCDADIMRMVKAQQIWVIRANSTDITACVSTEALDEDLMEFGYLCVRSEHKRKGLASKLISHSVDVAASRGHTTLQCELLIPRDLDKHPHIFKQMMLKDFYPKQGFEEVRRVPFEKAYPEVVARNKLAFECDAVIFQMSLALRKL